MVRPLKDTPGLTYRNEFGWVETTAKPFIKDLDSMPFPKWELLPYERYQMPKSSVHANVRFLPMWTSRGCPIGCHYCPYPVGQGEKWRRRSASNVVDEIEHLVNDLGIRYLIFRDPMFSLDQRRVVAICNDIAARGLKVQWRCETRVDYLNEETLTAMAKAGCEGVNFGIESSDVAIQKAVGRRPISREQFVNCIQTCRRLGIKTFAFFHHRIARGHRSHYSPDHRIRRRTQTGLGSIHGCVPIYRNQAACVGRLQWLGGGRRICLRQQPRSLDGQ
jgi:radical SAM superfamily enzyme YgiQ (UPF0313 family)